MFVWAVLPLVKNGILSLCPFNCCINPLIDLFDGTNVGAVPGVGNPVLALVGVSIGPLCRFTRFDKLFFSKI
jgi:hypothetical protein